MGKKRSNSVINNPSNPFEDEMEEILVVNNEKDLTIKEAKEEFLLSKIEFSENYKTYVDCIEILNGVLYAILNNKKLVSVLNGIEKDLYVSEFFIKDLTTSKDQVFFVENSTKIMKYNTNNGIVSLYYEFTTEN